ncbi:MAG: ribonuclease E/G, partial [Maricaulaceae bacterium]
MSRKMLIDAGHPEETRVVVTDRSRVIDFDFETESKQPLRGNIYLAKVTRVEPSLQAAFVEYGGNRHGFLAFNEIHPDYYQLPHEDRQALIEEESRAQSEGDGEDADEDPFEDAGRARRSIARRYKIQEVIKRRQILLVQVVKEERGNKGAALTTYLSLAGRYCVLMPNTARGGGISRKITNGVDRKKLKTTVQSLEVPKGMGLIVRTAGAQRTKTEIKRDYEYLLRLWERIREQTLESIAPTMIYEEGNLVRRAVRDLYDKDIDEVLVEGDAAYREAKDFMRMLMPSHAKKVQPYKDKVPLFLHHKVEPQLDAIYEPVVSLPSGGYLVINATEALVAIDVNSGKATRERNIEATALRTNMEAAEEAARQMRLRDLAGLVVIDFIDMEEGRNNRSVEKKMKEALRFDRARVQTSKISGFGLMEISRQRRRSSLLEGSTIPCPHCSGRGYIRSTPSSALSVLRAVEEKGARQNAALLQVSAPSDVVIYILNTKREHLRAIEERYTLKVAFTVDNELMAGEFEVEQMAARTRELDDDRSEPPALAGPSEDTRASADAIDVGEDEDGDAKKPRRRRRRKRRGEGADTGADNAETADAIEVIDTDAAETGASEIGDTDGETRASEDEDEDKPKRRRRRGRR